MVTKVRTFGLVIFTLLIISSINCTKESSKCIGDEYLFLIKAAFTPGSDSINLGDTLFFTFDFPTNLNDYIRQKTVDFSNATQIGVSLSFLELISSSPGIPKAAAADFDIIPLEGSVKTGLVPDKVKEFYFIESSNHYKVKIALKTKKKGIYFLGISDAGPVERLNSTGCTESAEFIVRIENPNQHLYFYQDNRPGYTISQYEKDHVYCFKVK